MAPSKFVPDPVFFGDPDGICGLAVTKLAGIAFQDDSDKLLHLVVSSSPPTASKEKLQLGHQVTKGMAKYHGASSPFLTTTVALHAVLTSEINQWNPAVEASVEFALSRLYCLRSSPVGGLLLVLKHWNVDTASYGKPIVRLVASPALATLGSFSATDLPGFNLQDAWDLSAPPLSEFSTSDSSCPLMVSAGGFSCRVFPPTLSNFLGSTAPLFLPNGEDVAGTV
jgi:hypothetical protein